LSKPGKDGSLREHLEQVERQTGRKLQELEAPDFPFTLSYLWSAFLSLNNSRSSGYSSNPISFTEIKAFVELTHIPLSARDVETIKLLDRKYLEVMNSDG
jgi:hypothetical protein